MSTLLDLSTTPTTTIRINNIKGVVKGGICLFVLFVFFSILNNRAFAFIKVSRRRHNIVLLGGAWGGWLFFARRIRI